MAKRKKLLEQTNPPRFVINPHHKIVVKYVYDKFIKKMVFRIRGLRVGVLEQYDGETEVEEFKTRLVELMQQYPTHSHISFEKRLSNYFERVAKRDQSLTSLTYMRMKKDKK